MHDIREAKGTFEKIMSGYLTDEGHYRGLNAEEEASVKTILEKLKEIDAEFDKWDWDTSCQGRPYKHGVNAPVLKSELDKGVFDIKIMKRNNGPLGEYYIFRTDAYKRSADNNLFCIDYYNGSYRLSTCNGNLLDYYTTIEEAMSTAMHDTADRLAEIYDKRNVTINFYRGKQVETKNYLFEKLSVKRAI